MPESACFLKVLLHLTATHLTTLFYLFDSSFSLKKEIFLVRTLHLFTWILRATVCKYRPKSTFCGTSPKFAFRISHFILTQPVTPAVLTTDSVSTFYSTLITCQIPAYNLYYTLQYTYLIQKSHFVWIQYIVQNCPKVGFFERRRQDVDDRAQRKQTLNKYSGVFY